MNFESEVSGRVIDENGKGVKGVQVDIVSADYKFGWRENGQAARLEFDFTDESGNYRIIGIPPGIYHVSIGVAGLPEYNEYEPTFHPNVIDRSKATIIRIVDGKKLPKFNFRLPKRKVK